MTAVFDLPKATRNLWVLAAVAAAGCVGAPTTAAGEAAFDGGSALARVAAQLSLGDRSPGMPGHGAVQQWIGHELETAGWRAEPQSFVYRGQTLTNLVASSSPGAQTYILVGAHYDTRPIADESGLPNPGPVPGADDGASGVAVLLGLADVLPPNGLGCTLDLAFFDGEDSGRLGGWDWIVGSTYLAAHLEQEPDAVVVVDMVGDKDLQLYWEQNSDPELRQEIWMVGGSLGYPAFIDQAKYSMLDDHSAFLAQGIPAVDVIDFDYPYWHTPEDTLDKVSAASLETVGRTLQAWLEGRCPH